MGIILSSNFQWNCIDPEEAWLCPKGELMCQLFTVVAWDEGLPGNRFQIAGKTDVLLSQTGSTGKSSVFT